MQLYLKEVQMENFKSFGKKLTVPFFPGFTAVTGPNGSGKSSLLQFVFGKQGNTKKVAKVKVAQKGGKYFTLDTLSPEQNPKLASNLLDMDTGLQLLLRWKSSGEVTRAMIEAGLGKEGLYVIDEPEASLDIKQQKQFAEAIKKRGNAVIATHSPIFWSIGTHFVELEKDYIKTATKVMGKACQYISRYEIGD